MQIKRFAAAATAGTMALSALAAPAGAATAVKRPSGKYNGATAQEGNLVINISKNRKFVKLIGFQFYCDDQASGVTGLQNLKLKKTSKGYKFSGAASSAATYSDDAPAEDGTVRVSGRFSKNGKAATGKFSVSTPRCGDVSTGVRWIAAK